MEDNITVTEVKMVDSNSVLLCHWRVLSFFEIRVSNIITDYLCSFHFYQVHGLWSHINIMYKHYIYYICYLYIIIYYILLLYYIYIFIISSRNTEFVQHFFLQSPSCLIFIYSYSISLMVYYYHGVSSILLFPPVCVIKYKLCFL